MSNFGENDLAGKNFHLFLKKDAGHQDYLVMIFSIAVVGLAGFGMLSALAHFILRLKGYISKISQNMFKIQKLAI